MSLARARRLWGRVAVAEALAHPAPRLPRETLDALCEASSWAAEAADLAAWADALPEDVRAGVIRLVAGVTRLELLQPKGDA